MRPRTRIALLGAGLSASKAVSEALASASPDSGSGGRRGVLGSPGNRTVAVKRHREPRPVLVRVPNPTLPRVRRLARAIVEEVGQPTTELFPKPEPAFTKRPRLGGDEAGLAERGQVVIGRVQVHRCLPGHLGSRSGPTQKSSDHRQPGYRA